MHLVHVLEARGTHLGVHAIRVECLYEFDNLAHAVAVVAHAVDVGRQIVCAGLGRPKGLVGRVDSRGEHADALGLDGGDGAQTLAGDGDLNDDVLAAANLRDALGFGQDALVVEADDLGDNLLVLGEHLAELSKNLVRLLARLSDDGGIGGHAVDGQKAAQLADGLNVGTVNKELHGISFPNTGRAKHAHTFPLLFAPRAAGRVPP